MNYGYSKKVDLSFEDAVKKVTEELQKEGFGVLTEIDVKATMKKKLDVEVNPYIILGACNPPIAHKVLQKEQEVGLFLPCNVIVYINDKNETIVSAIEAGTMMTVIENPEIQDLGYEVQKKLHSVIDAV
ncbi:DUF302 domain-containing protein [candidate division KSB1 bacterium]